MTQKNQPKIKYTLDFDVTPHQLRHTYITNLLYAGVDPKTVQYLAGHENSKTTMDIYAKVKYNKPEELFGVVNGAFHQAIAEWKRPFFMVRTPDNWEAESRKSPEYQGKTAQTLAQYGLKAARRAPQFSKR